MRFGRIILASLAPLLGLSTLAAPSAPSPAKPDAFIRLLQSVVQMVAPDIESPAITAREHPPLHAFLAISALADTPLRHSLWMVASNTTSEPPSRRPLQTHLRC